VVNPLSRTRFTGISRPSAEPSLGSRRSLEDSKTTFDITSLTDGDDDLALRVSFFAIKESLSYFA
jgi:hypothetical protein